MTEYERFFYFPDGRCYVAAYYPSTAPTPQWANADTMDRTKGKRSPKATATMSWPWDDDELQPYTDDGTCVP